MFGWQAEAAVEEARSDVAGLIGADPREIVWTSGATEANNLAIKGCAHFNTRKGKHIITSRIEHKAVLDTCRQLEREGLRLPISIQIKMALFSRRQLLMRCEMTLPWCLSCMSTMSWAH